MTSLGEMEKKTQARVVALFRKRLGCDYLGNWIDRPGNANIKSALITPINLVRVVEWLAGIFQIQPRTSFFTALASASG